MRSHIIPINTLLIVAVISLFATVENATAEDPPGVVVAYSAPATGKYLGDPSIVILPNGDYIVSHDAWGIGHQETYLYRSEDAGATWSYITSMYGQYTTSLFMHDGDLYLMGGANNGSQIAIRKSTDNGTTWTTPSSSTTGRLLTGGNYAMGATPVIVHDGRIWRAIEEVDPMVPPGTSKEFRSFMMSAPVGSDLMNAANWTSSNSLLLDDFLSNEGWLEGNPVVTPDGDMVIMLRTAGRWEAATVIDISANGATASFNVGTGVVGFAGGMSKFTIRYDNQTDRYWSLVNKAARPSATRNILALTSSEDLIYWTVEATILEHPDAANVGFQYVDFVFEGDDIIFVSRTAYNGAPNFHDSNYITFHRIEDFRSISQPGIITLDAIEDAEIDENTSWRNSTKGIPHPEWSWRADGIRVREYTNGEHSDVLIKWDVSGIDPGQTIDNATMNMVIWEWPDGAMEVYGIQQINNPQGNWAEDVVTWNNWAATSKTIVLLGLMDNSGKTPLGTCFFSNDNLTAWVQGWIDGSQQNCGLILKWAGTAFSGDEFSSRQSAYAPQLVLEFEPVCGDPGTVYLGPDLDTNCYVNWADFGLFAGQWLNTGCVDPTWCSGADLDQSGAVNWADFGIFAGQWLHCTDPANSSCDLYW